MAKLGTLRVDVDHAVWFDYRDGFAVQLLPATHPDYMRERNRLLQKLGRRKSVDIIGRILPLIIQYLLVDWRGLETDDGDAIPFTREQATEILKDRSMRTVVEWITECVGDDEAFAPGAAEAEGNFESA